MRKKNSTLEFGRERNEFLLRSFRESIAAQSKISIDNAFRQATEKPAPRFWVSEVRAANVIGKMLAGDDPTADYHERFWKSELLDFVILQQDAFDAIDANCPIERQKMMYNMVLDICRHDFPFTDFEECSQFFKGLINLFRQMNYSEWGSEKFEDYKRQIAEYVQEKAK